MYHSRRGPPLDLCSSLDLDNLQNTPTTLGIGTSTYTGLEIGLTGLGSCRLTIWFSGSSSGGVAFSSH